MNVNMFTIKSIKANSQLHHKINIYYIYIYRLKGAMEKMDALQTRTRLISLEVCLLVITMTIRITPTTRATPRKVRNMSCSLQTCLLYKMMWPAKTLLGVGETPLYTTFEWHVITWKSTLSQKCKDTTDLKLDMTNDDGHSMDIAFFIFFRDDPTNHWSNISRQLGKLIQ